MIVVSKRGVDAVFDARYEVNEGIVEDGEGDEGTKAEVGEFGGFDGVGEAVWAAEGLFYGGQCQSR